MNRIKRLLAVCVMIALVVAYFPTLCLIGGNDLVGYKDNELGRIHANADGDGSFSGDGNGTYVNPYRITTPEQLMEIQNNLSAYYYLENDLDMSNIDRW